MRKETKERGKMTQYDPIDDLNCCMIELRERAIDPKHFVKLDAAARLIEEVTQSIDDGE